MRVHDQVRGMEGPENKDAVLVLLACCLPPIPSWLLQDVVVMVVIEITTISILYICDLKHTYIHTLNPHTLTDTHTDTHTHTHPLWEGSQK